MNFKKKCCQNLVDISLHLLVVINFIVGKYFGIIYV